MDTAALKAYTLAVGYQSAALGAYDYAFGLQAIDRAEAGANPLPSLASRLDSASLLTTLPFTPPGWSRRRWWWRFRRWWRLIL